MVSGRDVVDDVHDLAVLLGGQQLAYKPSEFAVHVLAVVEGPAKNEKPLC